MSVAHFTADQIKQIASRDEYSDGEYIWKVVAASRTKSEALPEGISLQVAALRDPEDIESADRMRAFIRCDLGATETSGPVEKFQLENSAAVAAALFEDLPEWPFYNRAEKKTYLAGEEIKGTELQAAKEAALDGNLNKLVDIYLDESNEELNALVGKTFVATMKHNAGKEGTKNEGKMFPNVQNPRRALMEGETLVDPANFLYHANGKETEAAPAKKAPAKAAPKKGARR